MFSHSISNGRAGGHPFDNVARKLEDDDDRRGTVRMGLEVPLDRKGQPLLDKEEARQVFLRRMRHACPDVEAKVVDAYHLRKGWGEFVLTVWLSSQIVQKTIEEVGLGDLKAALRRYQGDGTAFIRFQTTRAIGGYADPEVIANRLAELMGSNGHPGVAAKTIRSFYSPGLQFVLVRLQPEETQTELPEF